MNKSIISNILIGTQFKSFGRSCDLLWFHFSDGIRDIYLHTQCIVRIIKDCQIVTTSEDIYSSISDDAEFNWEKFGDSIYDFKLANLLKNNKCHVLDIIESNTVHDYTIVLDNNTIMELLDNLSLDNDDERWRIIVKNENKHFVLRNQLISE